MNNKRLLYAVSIGVTALLIAVAGIIILFDNFFGVTSNIDKMMDRAVSLYEDGKTEDAFYQLQLYCDERPTNTDGYLLLGDWYTDENNTEKANDAYKKAAKNMEYSENDISEVDKTGILKTSSNSFSLRIEPSARYTKNMKLTISGENLTPKESQIGMINGTSEKLKDDSNYLTTGWFSIESEKKYLLLTGNMNCAIWQFANSSGDISEYTDKSDFRKTSNFMFANKSYSSVEIPKNTVKARVTYYNKGQKDLLKSNDNVFITYGKSLTGYTDTSEVTLDIPDLSEGQYITYKDGKWEYFDGKTTSSLDWKKLSVSKNSVISIDGELCGVVKVEYSDENVKKADKSMQYGIKYSTNSGVAACQRIGNARGMNFNYTVGNEWAEEGTNDFDNAYPWCEMKLCNVTVNSDGSKKITYEDDKAYKSDGSNGNVMVQIPKFYTKRTVSNGYEEILVSGTKHGGYTLEPVFMDSNGEELDYVYISAYLGAEKDDKIVSTADSYPTLLLTYGDTIRMAENNGEGFSEMNYLMCSALQKLFIVETGTIDSSSLFAGDSFKFYYYDTDKTENSGLAAKDAEKSNTITLYNNYGTQKIVKGSSIAIFSGWDSYTNSSAARREVLDVVTSEKYIEIKFDGKPLNIKKNKTTISNIPEKTGKTNSIDYCTGTLEGENGKVSFKYRNIENLYGSALIMLDDDAYVQDSYFYYYDAVGNLNMVNQPVAAQPKDLSNYSDANTKCCVKEMTYDAENPFVMLPSVVGGGSSSHNYYGDFWMYKSTENGTRKYLLYGGADDNSRLSGIFHMRAAILSENFSFSFYSARIMCK